MFRSEKIRKILRCAAFLCILALLAHGEERILNAKGAEDLSSAYFSEPKYSHDIILLGPSTIMNGVYPLLLWNRYGYTAYNLGAGNETIECSYYLAKRAIRQDHPRLIILDCGLLRKEDVIDSFSFLHFVTDRMPFLSPERLELLAHLAVYGKPSLGGLLKLCFPLLEYHERWADLTEADFAERDKTITYGAKVDPRKMSREPEPFAVREGNPDTVLPDHSERMLRKLIGLCKETGTGLLLVSMPTLNKTRYIGQKTYEARVDTAAAVGKIAAELDVPYINLVNDGSPFGLSLPDDTVEGFHLNVYGAEKFTAWIGEWISGKFDLEDRRGDDRFSYLDERYEAFRSYVRERTGGYELKEQDL